MFRSYAFQPKGPIETYVLTFQDFSAWFFCKGRCYLCDLIAFEDTHQSLNYALVNRRKYGNLLYASEDVIKVCTTTEKVIKNIIAENNGQPPNTPNLLQKVVNITFLTLHENCT